MSNTIEYEKLREEIKESDKICIGVLAFSFTLSATLLGIKGNDIINMNQLIILVQIVWVISYFYITNKRFSILSIANYIKKSLEPQPELKLNWETWKRENSMPKPIFDIYLVESITCLIPVLLIAIGHWLGIGEKINSFSVIIFIVFILLFGCNLYRYYNLKSLLKKP